MEAVLERLRFVHSETRKVIEAVPGEALDWAPGSGMNSICATVVHMLGAERYWLGDVARGEASGRDREAEFSAADVGRDALLARLAQADAYAEEALDDLDPEHLDVQRFSAMHGREYSAAWAIVHGVEHGALHVGHLQIIQQMWERSR